MATGTREAWDGVIVIGSGPNGLAAAIALAKAGIAVRVYEASSRVGGGLKCESSTLDGYIHDHCAAVHPMGILSPFFKSLPLQDFGLDWVYPEVSAAHPLADGRVALLCESITETADRLDEDRLGYLRLISRFVDAGPKLMNDLLAPLGIPSHPWTMLRLGHIGIGSASSVARRYFRGPLAQALFAGCAAHSILPLDKALTAALGILFCTTGHWTRWPMVRGGSEELAKALAKYFESLGGEIVLNHPIERWTDLPSARAYLFNTSPRTLVRVAGDMLKASERRRYERYRYGPGIYKIDFALSEKIPWRARECARASTVHLGGPIEEIEDSERQMWNGGISKTPFIMVCQQSHFDDTRAPAGRHTGYAYVHVPPHFDGDLQSVIESRIEAYAPGFKDCILASAISRPADFEAYNASFIGGAVTGGVADWKQAFMRPVARLDPYRTSHPQIYIGSAASPPGGGVHGMSGYHAARSILRRWGLPAPSLANG